MLRCSMEKGHHASMMTYNVRRHNRNRGMWTQRTSYPHFSVLPVDSCGLLRRLSPVRAVEAAALELNRRSGIHFMNLLFGAFRANRDRLVGKRLHHGEIVIAILAAVMISRQRSSFCISAVRHTNNRHAIYAASAICAARAQRNSHAYFVSTILARPVTSETGILHTANPDNNPNHQSNNESDRQTDYQSTNENNVIRQRIAALIRSQSLPIPIVFQFQSHPNLKASRVATPHSLSIDAQWNHAVGKTARPAYRRVAWCE